MTLAALLALAVPAACAVAALGYKFGVGKKAGDAIQHAPDVLDLVPANASDPVRAAAVLGHHIELAAKHELTGDALQAFLSFLSTGPTPVGIVAYAEENFGKGFLKDIEEDLPQLAADELAVFGDHLPTVIRDFAAKLLPGIAHAQAQQVLTSAEVQQRLITLTTAKSATAAAPVPVAVPAAG